MSLLSYTFRLEPAPGQRGDIVYATIRDADNPADNARIDRMWLLWRSKTSVRVAVWCVAANKKPYTPYSPERKAKLRATLDRKKREKKMAAIRAKHPLMADEIISKEFPEPL
jgi:hypothetical protein